MPIKVGDRVAINAGSVYSELILDTSKYEQNLKKSEQQMNTFSKNLEKTGKSMEKVGKSLSKYVTAPVVGLGAAALKVGTDFQSGMSEVQAISGATGDDLAALEEKAKEMGATTKFSASESAEALKYMAMAGWDTNQMLDGLDGVMNLAAASGEELGLVSDIVTDALTAFGMEAKQAGEFADLLASASSNSNTNVGMLGESFKYVAPVFGSLGYSAEDAALALGLMANAGIKASQSGTSLRASISRLIKPTDDSAKLINELGIKLTDVEGNMLPFKDVMDQLRDTFGDLTQEQQSQYAATIFGQEAMSGMLAIINASEADYNKLTTATRDYNGSAKEMADTMQDNLQGQLTILKSQLEGVGIQLAETLIPIVSKMVDKISEWVDKFASLDDETQENIIKMAGLAAAIGPVLSIGGKLARGTSSIISLFGKLSLGTTAATTTVASLGNASAIGATKVGGLGLAAKASTLLLNPWTAAIAAGGLVAYGLYKNLSEDAIPAIDLFGDEVSENTKEAVGGFLELEEKATLALKQMSWSGQEVTEEMANIITGNINAMKDQVVSKLEEQKTEAISSMQEMVTNSITMTQEEKDEILRITEESYDKQIHSNGVRAREINQILEKASEARRQLTQEERERILELQEGMKEDAVRIFSESEAEQMAIMERLKANSSELSAQQAAEIVKNSVEQKEKTIAEAEEEYEERLKYAAELRASGSKEAEKMADKIVEEATRQKDEAIKNAEEMHDKVIYEAQLQAQEHVNQVDWETGEIKTKWEVMKQDIATKAEEIKENVKEKWEEIKQNTYEKWNEIKTDLANDWDNIKTNTSTTLQNIKENVANKWEEIKINTSEKWSSIRTTISEKATSIRDKIVDSITDAESRWDSSTAAMESAGSRFSRLASSIGSAFSSIVSSISSGISALLDWNSTKVENKTATFTTIFKTVGEAPGGGGVGAFARGTNYAPGGLALVGEEGPELIELPRGSKVHTAQQTERMMKGAGGGITQHITINSPTPLTPSEIARKNLQASRQLAMEWGV